MKTAQLVPWINAETTQSDVPLEKMKSKIERTARHWPLVLSQTIIFNMSASLEPLLSIVLKVSMLVNLSIANTLDPCFEQGMRS